MPNAAHAACPHPVDDTAEETLFTFNTLIYAASSVADVQQYNELRQFLLVYQPNETLDRAQPIRFGVADAVADWPQALRLRILQFLLTHKAAATNYNALVLQLVGPPPLFKPYDQEVPGGDNEQLIFNHRAKLANLLREAYRVGKVGDLWTRWQGPWQDAQICSDHLLQLQHQVATYVHAPDPHNPEGSLVIHNPLMPFGSGVTCVFSDAHFVMIIGPTLNPREQDLLISHELTHPLLNQLLRADRRMRVALNDSECVFDAIRHNTPNAVLTRYVYNTWESYFSESLVRSISHRMIFLPDPANGFVLASFLDDELTHYETGHTPFVEAMLHSLSVLHRDWCLGPPQMTHTSAATRHPRKYFHQ